MNDILSWISFSACSSTRMYRLWRDMTLTMVIIVIFALLPLSVSLRYRSYRSGGNTVQSRPSLANARGSLIAFVLYFSFRASFRRLLIQYHGRLKNKVDF
jgi:hypothetical protein